MKDFVVEYSQYGRRIVKGLGYYEKKPVEDLKQLVKNCAWEYGNKVGFKFKTCDGTILDKRLTAWGQPW